MSTTPRRSNSLRKSIEKVGDVLHLHKEPSGQLHLTQLRHGCRSEEESEALRQLQEELQKNNITLPPDMIYAGDLDATLLRFLRARKWKVDATIAQLTGCINWRKENNVDKVLQNPFDSQKLEVIRRHKPASYIGFDKLGRPIYVDRIGQMDPRKILDAGMAEQDILTYHIQEMEYMGRVLLREASERVGHTVDSVVMILDASGIRLSTLTGPVKSLFSKLVAVDQDNYPETNGGTYVVNASMVFTTVWTILRPFLDKNTANKVKVLGSGPRAHAQLAEVFDLQQLPQFLGGEQDFDGCRDTWNSKMDTALEEAQKRARELAERKEMRGSSLASHSPSMPGTPVGRTPTAVSDTLAAAAAIAAAGGAGGQSPSHSTGMVRRASSGSASVNSIQLLPQSNSQNGVLLGNMSNGSVDSLLPASPPVGANGTIPEGLSPIRLERMSDGQSEYGDAEEFYTPRSTLSRASSSSSYADVTDLEAFSSSKSDSQSRDSPTHPSNSNSPTPTKSDITKAASINAKDSNVSITPPMAKSHAPDLATIDETAQQEQDKQPGCKCTIM